MQLWKYENIQIYKYGKIQIYMKKNINVKNAKEWVKKVNTNMKNYKVTSNETLAKIQINKTKKKYVKMTNIQIYSNVHRKRFMWKYKRVYKKCIKNCIKKCIKSV